MFLPLAVFGWTSSGPPLRFPSEVAGVATDPANPNVVYASDGNGFFRSDDAGGHWTQLSSTPLDWVLAVDPANSRVVYSGSILKSADGGITWDNADDGVTCVAASIAVAPSAPNVLYSTGYNPGHSTGQCAGTFRSDDFGAHWRLLPMEYGDLIAADPVDADIVYLVDLYVTHAALVSFDGGMTVSFMPYVPSTAAFAIDPENPMHLYAAGSLDVAGSSGGVIESHDRGVTWTVVGQPTIGECPLTFNSLVIDPVAANVLFASATNTCGGADNGTGGGVFQSTDAGRSWRRLGLDDKPVANLVIDSKGRFLHASVAGDGVIDQPISRPRIIPVISPAPPNLIPGRPNLAQLGIWGSSVASLAITDSGATLQILASGDCYGSYGTIGTPIPRGPFALAGTYTQLIGAYPGMIQYDASFSGSVEGNQMVITVVVPALQESFGPFDLTYGVQTSWQPCEYPGPSSALRLSTHRR